MKKLTGLILVLATTWLFTVTTCADTIINPSDDAWTDRDNADANRNGLALQADYSYLLGFEVTQRIYIRFDLLALVQDVDDRAKIRLYVTGAPLETTGTLSIWSTGDDWNGTAGGDGSETTLTWNNAPAPITKLGTEPADTGSQDAWIEFTGSLLSTFINSQRSATGGDGVASFMVEWDGCSTCAFIVDNITFEDNENSEGTGNRPELRAPPPTAITLASLTVRLHQGSALVEWETATEVDNLGFHLYRSDAPAGKWQRLNQSLIPARAPGSPVGAGYEFLDQSVVPGMSYYWLEDVDVYGVTTLHGPVSITLPAYLYRLPIRRRLLPPLRPR